MAADIEPPMSSERSRRARRAVITDDSYGDGGYLDRDDVSAGPERDLPRPPVPRSRRGGGGRAEAPSREKRGPSGGGANQSEGGGVAWRLAALATLLWVGGVGAFAAGFFQLPLQPLDALPRAALSLPPHLLLMTGAVLIAPLGLIWLSALTARRAAALRQETAKLSAAVAAGGGGASAGAAPGPDASRLRGEAEAAARAVSDFESSLDATVERAELARERLQAEREALTRLLDDVDRRSGRIADTLAATRAAAQSDAPPMGLEPSSMLAGVPPRESRAPEPPRAPDPFAKDPLVTPAPARAARGGLDLGADLDPGPTEPDDYGDDDEEEYTPALAPERRSPETTTMIGQESERGGRSSQLDQIDALRRRVQGGRSETVSAAAAAPAAAAAKPAAGGSASLDWNKLVKAANFPESEEDQETLDALYAVLTDPEAAALLQAAEDALSALADAGLYMEDMQPHHAPTELWRAYAVDGQRRDVMDLGGVRDPHAIEDATEALRSKPEFNATAERFMDRYETVVERLFAEAPDPTMAVELADTRSGRAYMLLARASGRFG